MPDTKPTITPIKDGALRVSGLTQLQTDDGVIECGPVVALCRCGQSANKPFCDGTHVGIGFTDDAVSGSEPDRRDSYAGKEITIHDNRDICAHAGYCTSGLPNVFQHGTEPWIDPDHDTAERVMETIRKCPSGALSYSIDGVEFRNPAARPPDVEITAPGPYVLTGNVELAKGVWAEGASTEHFELCRCGGSKRKPFCDGSHWEVWKDGAETKPAATAATGPRPTAEEPHVAFIHELAANGLSRVGEAGPMVAMGVPRAELPKWDDIQIMVSQLARRPLLDDAPVGSELVIGPKARQPLRLEIPLFVSDMSYGALSEEAKVSLAQGAELAGTGICSGEGGMLPEEQAANSRYFYEYASGAFGFEEEKLTRVQAMHFKAGQGAKTGTGGHLPGAKVVGKIAEVRGLEPGTDSISPATFPDLATPADFARFSDRAREVSVAGSRERDGLGSLRRRLGLDRHAVLPVLPVAVLDAESEGRAERAAVAQARGPGHAVALDEHAAAAAVAVLAASELGGVLRQLGALPVHRSIEGWIEGLVAPVAVGEAGVEADVAGAELVADLPYLRHRNPIGPHVSSVSEHMA
jgi:CDGSH-type Zn-finger protein